MPGDFLMAGPALLLVVGEREDLLKLVGLDISDMPEVHVALSAWKNCKSPEPLLLNALPICVCVFELPSVMDVMS